MPTPSIQTLVTDAQQVLNLDSISAVRSVVAVALANANTGTPLNPNLTTQQLWNEFYQVVTKPKSDIESIIANQLMKFLHAPPAPGGVGANGQVIFNDNGVLAGDPQFLWNKTTNLLTVTGAATITGDLTVDTNVLKVDSANNRVGIGTASPTTTLHINGNARIDGATGELLMGTGAARTISASGAGGGGGAGGILTFKRWDGVSAYVSDVVMDGSGNLGLGVTPSAWNSSASALEFKNGIALYSFGGGTNGNFITNGFYNSGGSFIYKTSNTATRYQQFDGSHLWYTAPSGTAGNAITFTQAMTLDANGNLLVGTTSQAGRLTVRTAIDNTTVAEFGATSRPVSFTTSANGANDNGFFNFVSSSIVGAFSFQNSNGKLLEVGSDGNIILYSSTTPTPLTVNGQLTVNATSNTNLRFSYRGSDGVTRVANITLA